LFDGVRVGREGDRKRPSGASRLDAVGEQVGDRLATSRGNLHTGAGLVEQARHFRVGRERKHRPAGSEVFPQLGRHNFRAAGGGAEQQQVEAPEHRERLLKRNGLAPVKLPAHAEAARIARIGFAERPEGEHANCAGHPRTVAPAGCGEGVGDGGGRGERAKASEEAYVERAVEGCFAGGGRAASVFVVPHWIVEKGAVEAVIDRGRLEIECGVVAAIGRLGLPSGEDNRARSAQHATLAPAVHCAQHLLLPAHRREGPRVAKVGHVRHAEAPRQVGPHHRPGPRVAGAPHHVRPHAPHHLREAAILQQEKRQPRVYRKLTVEPLEEAFAPGFDFFTRKPRCAAAVIGRGASRGRPELALGGGGAVEGRMQANDFHLVKQPGFLRRQLLSFRSDGQHGGAPPEVAQVQDEPEGAHRADAPAREKVRGQQQGALRGGAHRSGKGSGHV